MINHNAIIFSSARRPNVFRCHLLRPRLAESTPISPLPTIWWTVSRTIRRASHHAAYIRTLSHSARTCATTARPTKRGTQKDLRLVKRELRTTLRAVYGTKQCGPARGYSQAKLWCKPRSQCQALFWWPCATLRLLCRSGRLARAALQSAARAESDSEQRRNKIASCKNDIKDLSILI